MTTQRSKRTQPRSAFTLMEMLIVVAIIVLLAGVSAYGYIRYLESARESTAKVNMVHITNECMHYQVDNGTFPASLNDLTQSTDGKVAYLEAKDLKDPWGQDYQYDSSQLSATGKPLVYSTHPVATGQLNNR